MNIYENLTIFLMITTLLVGCGVEDGHKNLVCRPNSSQIQEAQNALESMEEKYSFKGFANAWKNGDTETVRLYFKAGLVDRIEDGRNLLHIAAKNNWKKLVRMCLECNMNIDARIYNKYWTPLHLAIREENLELAKWLINEGADLNIGSKGRTPLHSAVGRGYKEIVKLMLDKGANVNAKDSHGRTPMDYAVGYPEIQELLKKHKTE